MINKYLVNEEIDINNLINKTRQAFGIKDVKLGQGKNPDNSHFAQRSVDRDVTNDDINNLLTGINKKDIQYIRNIHSNNGFESVLQDYKTKLSAIFNYDNRLTPDNPDRHELRYITILKPKSDKTGKIQTPKFKLGDQIYISNSPKIDKLTPIYTDFNTHKKLYIQLKNKPVSPNKPQLLKDKEQQLQKLYNNMIKIVLNYYMEKYPKLNEVKGDLEQILDINMLEQTIISLLDESDDKQLIFQL